MSDFAERRRVAVALCAFTISLTAVRLWLASRLGLAPDEAYYWTWSRALSLVYRDHPPLVAYAIALGTRAVSGEVGVRLPAILCGAAAVPLVYLAATRVGLKRRMAAFAAILSALLPIFSAGTLIVTPDSLLGVAWLAGGLALQRLAAGADSRNAVLFWLATGVGLWAKHSALLLPIAAAASALCAPNLRASLRSRSSLVGAGLCALLVSPYLAAELFEGAPSFFFQLSHLRGALFADGAIGISTIARRLGELVSGQLGLLTPPIAILFALSFGALGRENPSLRVAQILAIVPMAATALAALGTHPEQNWASLGHPFAAVAAISAAEARFEKAGRRAWLSAAALCVVGASVLIHVHAAAPFLPLPPDRDPVSRLHGYEGLAAVVDERTSGVRAIACDNYGLASELAWLMRDDSDGPVIGSLDRGGTLPVGRWLLLDESGDPSGADFSEAPCARKRITGAVSLERADGTVVRTVTLYDGSACGGVPAEVFQPCQKRTPCLKWQ